MSRLTRIGEKGADFILRSAVPAGVKGCAQLLSVVLVFAWCEAARGTTVRAQLGRSSVMVGDSVELEVIVGDSPGGSISAELTDVEGISIRRTGSGWRFENGRRSDILNFMVTPAVEGRFVISGITVKANGQTFKTNQVVLTATKVPETAEMRLTASVTKRECYVFEPADVRFDWYISSDVRRPELNIPLLRDKDELSLKVVPPPASAEELRIVANRYELTASRSLKELEGKTYTVLSLVFRIFPPRAGKWTIERATVVAEVQTGYKWVTDSFFGVRRRVPDYERVFAASEPIEVVVKSLPEEGKPAGFTGAVGKFKVSLQTSDTQVKVGDPMLLKVMISGTGLLEKIKRPLLSRDPAFAEGFSINESLAPGDISGERVTFEQTIRAKSEDVKEIPALAFPYFNPEEGKYEVARSKPIGITVLPTTEVTAEDVIRFGADVPGGETTALVERPGGILANYVHLDALRNQEVSLRSLWVLICPPALYLSVLAIVSRRRKLSGDVAFARSKSAKKWLKKHLAESRKHLPGEDRQFYDSVARAVSRFTSDKLNLGTGELTAYDVEVLAGQGKIDEETSRKMAEVLRRCDAARFAPAAGSAEDRMELLRRAEEVIRTLGRKL